MRNMEPHIPVFEFIIGKIAFIRRNSFKLPMNLPRKRNPRRRRRRRRRRYRHSRFLQLLKFAPVQLTTRSPFQL